MIRLLHDDSVSSERGGYLVVIAALEHGADVVIEYLYLVASDLRPAGIVANNSNNRNVVTREGIELGERVAD